MKRILSYNSASLESLNNEGSKVKKKAAIAAMKVGDVKNENEIRRTMYALLNTMAPLVRLRKGWTVLIKVNLCLLIGPETGGTVDPLLVECLVDWLQERYKIKECIIAESDATHLSADLAFQVLGWHERFSDKSGCHLLNLSKDEIIEVSVNGLHFRQLRMAKTYMEADYLISFGKMKTHVEQKMSCIMKNQFGANPYRYKIKYHPFLKEAIYDMNKVRMPDFCLLDGLIGMERKGPVYGVPKIMGLLIAGTDAVATDVFCAQMMGIKPRRVPYLYLAMKKGLGTRDFDLLTPPLAKNLYRFASMPWYTALAKRVVSLLQPRGEAM